MVVAATGEIRPVGLCMIIKSPMVVRSIRVTHAPSGQGIKH